MMGPGLTPRFADYTEAHDPNPSFILPPIPDRMPVPLPDRMPVQTRGTSIAGALFWNTHRVDKISKPRSFPVHILRFPLSQLCFCRASDRHHYLREEGGGAPLLFFYGLTINRAPSALFLQRPRQLHLFQRWASMLFPSSSKRLWWGWGYMVELEMENIE